MSPFFFLAIPSFPAPDVIFSAHALMAGSALAGTQIVSPLATTSPEPVRKVAGILTWYKQGRMPMC